MRVRSDSAVALCVLLLAACGDDDAASPAPASVGGWCHAAADGTTCDDDNPCTTDDVCGNGVCLGRPIDEALACDDGSPCTAGDVCAQGSCAGAPLDCAAEPEACLSLGCVEAPTCDCPAPTTECRVSVCDEATGECSVAPAADGAACDDGQLCTSADACAAGVCGGDAVECPGGGPCHVPYCDPLDGACRTQQLPNGTVCDDSNPCSLGETCGFGECGGSTPSADGSPCDDADPCTTDGACAAGWCEGVEVDCSEHGEGCLMGVCDPALGGCVTAPGPDGVLCEDGDPCTVIESCKAGVCAGGTNTCFCKGKADGTACDDDNACTVGDVCAAEQCGGQGKDCAGLDSQCAVGACDPASGSCVAAPLATGTPCDDKKPCTVADGCAFGVCAGLPKDCSSLDTVCATGVCAADSGECAATPLADGAPCDDEDACSGHDGCAAGVCAGDKDLCGACTGEAVGAPCDDGDACTDGEACVEKGALLVCEGPPLTCPPAPACQTAFCAAGSGACETAPGPDGVGCDDSDACTLEDTCAGGACAGAPIGMCGATVVDCESGAPNDEPTQAWSVVPAAQDEWTATWSGMVRADPAGDSDWLALEVQGGQLISVVTRAHCQSALDTTVAVHRVTGTTGVQLLLEELAYADAGGVGLFGAVQDVAAPVDGTYLLRVGAWPSSGEGSYLVDITVAWPEPCSSDSDCTCPQLACQADGKCAPGMPEETEPNGTLQSAEPVAVPAAWRGTFFSPDDADWFAVQLQAGVPVDVTTSDFCEDGSDPAIALHDPQGKLLATDQDSGPGGHALIDDFVPAETGPYYVLVSDQVVAGGAYVVSITEGGCQFDFECACADQACGAQADPGLPKLCLPNLTTAEVVGAPAALPVAARMHAELGGPGDVDEFEVQLGGGTWELRTETYCGSSVDTLLQVFGPAGALLAEDDDGGADFFAAVGAFETSEPLTVRLKVSVASGEGGAYIVTAVEADSP